MNDLFCPAYTLISLEIGQYCISGKYIVEILYCTWICCKWQKIYVDKNCADNHSIYVYILYIHHLNICLRYFINKTQTHIVSYPYHLCHSPILTS